MDVINSTDPRYNTTSHPSFRFVHNKIMARIDTEKSNVEVANYSQIQHNTRREMCIQRAFRLLIDQGLDRGIDVKICPPKFVLRNKANVYDVRRALILEDCDDLSVALLDLIIISQPFNDHEICAFVHHLQLARDCYAAYPNTSTDD